MISEIERKTVELALIRAIPLMCKANPGRVRGLSERLGRQVDARVMRLPRLSEQQALVLRDKINEFSKHQSKWQTRGAHACTYVSFCLDLIDNRPWPEIKQTLCDIVDYFDRAGKLPTPSSWAGALARERFDSVMEG